MDFLPPRGMRDITPEMKILRENVFKKIEKIFQKYGFDSIATPIVEKWDTLKGKYGGEAEDKLMWRFQLPYSDKWFALRYDLTVPLVRYYANSRPNLPFKRYQIGPVYRYESPQKGRYREFYQCDADIMGEIEPFPDIEIIDMVKEIFNEFNLPKYEIRLNDRRMLKNIFERSLDIKDNSMMLQILRSIDKLDKINKEGVINELNKLGLNKNKIEYISNILHTSKYSNEETLNFLKEFNYKDVKKGINLFENIIDYSKSKNIKIDLSLVRGLDYYTGMIYEVVVHEPKIGSLAGGGRYDNLIGNFIKENIPAVGGTIGVERLLDAGLETGIFKLERGTLSEIGVIPLSEDVMRYAWEITKILRKGDVNTYLLYEPTKPVKGIKHLEKRGIKYAVFIGSSEVKNKIITFQDLDTRERKEYKINDLNKLTKKVKAK